MENNYIHKAPIILLDYSRLPNNLAIGMSYYIELHIQAGSFLTAVLCNDLKVACAKADHVNRRNLCEIVEWLHQYAPSDSWGSAENVESWLAGKM